MARLAQVHPGTVSRALDPERAELVNEATRERVLAAAVELGYRGNAVARSLRTGRSGIIGVVAADLGNPYLPPILRGVEQVVGEAGFTVLIAETHDAPGRLKEITDHLVTRRVDAVILAAAHLDDAPLVDHHQRIAAGRARGPRPRGARRTSPCCTTMSWAPGSPPSTSFGLGHRRLAQLRGPQQRAVVRGPAPTPTRPWWPAPGVDRPDPGRRGDRTDHRGGPAARRCSRWTGPPARRPTAVFAHNDMLAVGALTAIAELGLALPRRRLAGRLQRLSADRPPGAAADDRPAAELRARPAGRRRWRCPASTGTPAARGTVRLHPELILRESTRRYDGA